LPSFRPKQRERSLKRIIEPDKILQILKKTPEKMVETHNENRKEK